MQAAHLDAYRTVDAVTADPVALTLMLLDGAGRFLHDARRALAADDRAGFRHAETRAHRVIAELAGGLDQAAGGEAARNLGRLYDFMLRHLTEGLSASSGGHLERVQALLLEIRSGFEGAAARVGRDSR